MVAPLEPRDRPFGERADAVEFERIEAQPVLDQTVGGEAWVVLIVEQSEGAGHRGEKNTVLRAAARLDAPHGGDEPARCRARRRSCTDGGGLVTSGEVGAATS